MTERSKVLQCSHCLRMSDVGHGKYNYCFECEKRYVLKDIEKEKLLEKTREEQKRIQLLKKVRVECWHCGDKKQKIQSIEEGFHCTNCNDLLWCGDGGYIEKHGVWK